MNEEIKNEEIKYLGDVQRLVLKPGDTVVLMMPGSLSTDVRKRLKDAFAQEFEGHRVVVLADGLKIGVLGAESE